MTHLNTLSGAYALNALNEEERTLFEQHLAECEECAQETASFIETATYFSTTQIHTPTPELKANIVKNIKHIRPLPPLSTPVTKTPTDELTHRRKRKQGRVKVPALLGAVAAVAAIVLTPITPTSLQQPTQQTPTVTSMLDKVLTDKNAQRVSVKVDEVSKLTLTRSVRLGRAAITLENMAPAGEGKTYQLWLQHPKKGMQPAGVLPPGSDQSMLLQGDATIAVGAGVTIEPQGGSQIPTSKPVALFNLDT